jgi:hypothetical protein
MFFVLTSQNINKRINCTILFVKEKLKASNDKMPIISLHFFTYLILKKKINFAERPFQKDSWIRPVVILLQIQHF